MSTDNLPVRRRGVVEAWTAFWFSPRDPLGLALIRVLAGMVTLYTLVVYGFTLDVFHGEDALLSNEFRRLTFHDRAVAVAALSGKESPTPAPETTFQEKYLKDYREKWGQASPGPLPRTLEESAFADQFRQQNGFDFRLLGLPFPATRTEQEYLTEYTARYHLPMPPPFPATQAERDQIDEYMALHHNNDPRKLIARGQTIWSPFIDMGDPTGQWILHGFFVAVAACFLLGLGTRLTAPLTWFANLCYIHRNPTVLFGVDTMMTIMLLYLAIGPSGAALSLDRCLVRWWRRARGIEDRPPAPSVSAGLAIRLLQVHLCIVYFVSGLAKLQGATWWNGTAVWSVLANYEFAPMQSELYQAALRALGSNQLVFDVFITGAGYFTLAFEISYPFLIWRPSTRWFFLASAIWLHGFIGLFMGLKTFSLLMLIFNMAFLRPEEVRWILSWFGLGAERRPPTTAAPHAEPAVAGERA